jgi:dual specificity tyrosine-phosphorylation-regulated kinase 2/3/4
VAAKISKNKKFDVDNANVEIKLLNKLRLGNDFDNEGKDCLVEFTDSFKFRQHVIIIFECLSLNLYSYQKLNKRLQPVFKSM